ncbi:MAG TPA: rhodanese-like domain-containing protein [Desulfitobacteriaceae bacterium]|nr:rhodanese-like domain-containing protein [Desulfitobacteriaceae bacterium]
MEFRQIYTPGLAHLSYLISGKTSCIVVDPARDVSRYLQIAETMQVPITAVILTHLHADFISGHIELAQIPEAEIFISKKAEAAFPHYGLSDGEEFKLDQFLIKMLETPGHTPESSVFAVSDLERGPVPTLIFSGDTLLVGDVGRPDLFPYIKEELALFLYHSLRRIEKLGDYLEVYPAHGAGSLCGKKLSAKLLSTIGTERLYNGPLNIHPEEEFVRQLLLGMPEVPDYFSRCSRINRLGPALVSDLLKPKACDPREFLRLAINGCLVVDTRDPLPFCAAHIPGAYALSLKGNFATYAGWVLSQEKPLLLVVESKKDLEAALSGLYSVGLDNIAGYLFGGMTTWAASGLKTAKIENISAEELQVRLQTREIILVDVRLKSEFDLAHIFGSIHVPAPDVRRRYWEWEDSDKPVAFICNTGSRSLLAASLMLRYSRPKKVINVMGGTEAWAKMGYPLVSTES